MSDDPILGLALGGGGEFAAAHVGVLQVLAERGIRPGIVTGTSSGALVAAAYAAGFDPSAIERVALVFRWRAIARWSFTPRWGCSTRDPWLTRCAAGSAPTRLSNAFPVGSPRSPPTSGPGAQ